MLYSYPKQPNGTDCYGLNSKSVQKVVDIKQTDNTECWGKYFTDSGLFKWGEINLFENQQHLKDFRLTIDYPEDYKFCTKLYKDLVSNYGIDFNLIHLFEVLNSSEYQKLLDKMKELEKKWDTHFIQCTSDVERDAERLKKNIC